MAPPLPRSALVLITGASTGIGLATARRLIRASDYRLLLTARESSLGRFRDAGIAEGERVFLRPLNVLEEGERRAVLDEANQDLGGVDALINNAGIAYRAVVEHVREEERLAQMGINFRAPMELARLALPTMRAKRRGRIINVSSVGGMMAMPTMAVYSASKFALEGATESLWYEVRPWGIAVSLIEPGFVNSSGFENTVYTESSASSANRREAAYYRHYQEMGAFITRLMRRSLATEEGIARRIHRVLESRRPPLRVQATLDARLFSLLRRLLPQRLYHEILYRSLPGIRRWGPQD